MKIAPSSTRTAPGADPWPSRDTYPGDPERASLVYRGVVRWGHCLVRGYHRFELRGHAFPEEAPVLLVQNHTNGLCDAHFLMTAGKRPIRILVKYKLMTTPLFGWLLRRMDAVPMYRKKDGVDTRQNQKSFEAIDEALAEGSVIALFPEGESLDAIGLRGLRTGVARMAISAEGAREGGIGLRIVPLGVTYERRDRYRTVASGVIAEPIDVAAVLEGLPADEPRAQVTGLMDAIRERLEGVVFSAESPEEYETVCALERILPADDTPLGLRRKDAARRLRGDRSGSADQRAEMARKIGQSLEGARLRGEDILGERPGVAGTWGPLLWIVPVVMVFGVLMLPPILAGAQLARLRKTPDKMVTLRVTFTYLLGAAWSAGLFLWLLLTGAGVAATFVAIGFAVLTMTRLWPRTMDAFLRARGRIARRALEPGGGSEEIEALRAGIRSIREGYGAAT